MPDIFVSDRPLESQPDKTRMSSEEKTTSFLASFSLNPKNITFQNQEDDEEILLFLRRHLITNLPWLLISIFLTFLPLALPILFPFLSQSIPFLSSLPKNYVLAISIFYYLLVFGYFLVNFMTWYFNVFIVTQKRVIDIDFADLVYHNVALTKLDLIQDIDYTQAGFIRSLFNYGDLFVQTAGDKPNFEARAIPYPSKAAQLIEDLIGQGGGNVP